VKNYTAGKYTQNALGNPKKLDKDEIVTLITDFLLYDNTFLTMEGMNMLYRHFK
jgi:hypothetical protein